MDRLLFKPFEKLTRSMNIERITVWLESVCEQDGRRRRDGEQPVRSEQVLLRSDAK